MNFKQIYGNRIQVKVLNPFDPGETMDDRAKRLSSSRPDASVIVAPGGEPANSRLEVPDSMIQDLQFRLGRVIAVGDGEKCAPYREGMKVALLKMGATKLIDKTLLVSTEDVLGTFD